MAGAARRGRAACSTFVPTVWLASAIVKSPLLRRGASCRWRPHTGSALRNAPARVIANRQARTCAAADPADQKRHERHQYQNGDMSVNRAARNPNSVIKRRCGNCRWLARLRCRSNRWFLGARRGCCCDDRARARKIKARIGGEWVGNLKQRRARWRRRSRSFGRRKRHSRF